MAEVNWCAPNLKKKKKKTPLVAELDLEIDLLVFLSYLPGTINRS